MTHEHETLDLTPEELCALIQGLRGQVSNRLYWMMSPSHPIRGMNLGEEAEVLNNMAQAYSKAFMVARDSDHIVDEFKTFFMLSQRVWDMLLIVDQADSWDDVPTHKHGPLTCPLCEELILAV